jgi:hypothetical protein
MEGQDGHFLANPDASMLFFFLLKLNVLDDAAAVSSRFLL